MLLLISGRPREWFSHAVEMPGDADLLESPVHSAHYMDCAKGRRVLSPRIMLYLTHGLSTGIIYALWLTVFSKAALLYFPDCSLSLPPGPYSFLTMSPSIVGKQGQKTNFHDKPNVELKLTPLRCWIFYYWTYIAYFLTFLMMNSLPGET